MTYSVNWVSIHDPKIISPINTAKIFGTKVNVCSCMEVTVWNILTTNPTIISREKRPLTEILPEIRAHIGPDQWLFAQVISDTADAMCREAAFYIEKIGAELADAMAMCGAKDVASITRDMIF